ncbi:MAG: hypothetical protein K0S44_490 [Bacteroidetes bacterium]|jgi:hypothetical protein|nr:hypothetical protein [Bacteroidota bacterium]
MLKKIAVLSIAAALTACGNDSSKTETTEVPKDTIKPVPQTQPENELADFEFHTLVINIPSPFEILTFLPKSGIPYNKSLLNPVENEKKYTTTTKKGLNYGAYIVDLVYLSTNEQYSDIKTYFKTTRNLAVSLDCAESFDRISGSRLEKNIDQKDTINKVIDQIFIEMDDYLRSNERLLTATQILVGSWIESQYITTTLLKDQTKNKDNEILYQKVLQQNFTSQKLVQLLKEFEKEKEFMPVIKGVQELDQIYSGLKGDNIDKPTMEKLAAKLTEVRGKIVN